MIEIAAPAAAATAFGATYLGMPPLIRLLVRLGRTVPDAHKRPQTQVAMPAGPVLATSIISALAILYMFSQMDAFLAAMMATAAAFAAGYVDDLRPMPAWFKPVTLGIAAFPILYIGAYDTDMAFPPFGEVHIPILYLGLVAAMMVVMGNASNSIDVLNGVLSGFMGIAGTALAVSLAILGQYWPAAAALAIAATSAAYYRYHRMPTRIFPGDSGALALGAAYAAVAIAGGAEVISAVIILPAIANSFFFLSSTGKIVEFKRTRRPVEVVEGDVTKLRATPDRLAPVTLVRLILARGPLTESQVARRIHQLAVFCGGLGILTAVLQGWLV